MIEIVDLPAERWEDFRSLRLKALRSDPTAFGSSFEEEELFTEEEWKRRIRNTIFALSNDRPVGMIVYVSDRTKTRHVAEIFGVYVEAEYRGRGIGRRLLEEAQSRIRKERNIVKVKLAVNSEQRVAVKLYRNAGFVVAGKLKELKTGRGYFDELIMELLL